MAVVKLNIENALLSMTDNLGTLTDSEQARLQWASDFAQIIHDAILSADVIGVTTIVTGASPSGAVTGTGTQNNTGQLQ